MNWQLVKMKEVFDVRDGTHDSPKYQESGYPLVTSKNLKNGEIDLGNVKFISESDYLNINKRSKVDVDDVLFGMIGTIGNPTIIKEEPLFAIKNVALFKSNENQSSKFLKYYLESTAVVDKMKSEAKGTTQQFVGLGYLREFPYFKVPIQEQQQIVTILDEAFDAINQAKANIEKNIANAKELFQSKLNEIFSQKGEGWEDSKLTEVVSLKSGITLNKSLEKQKGEIPYLMVSDMNIEGNEFEITTSTKFVNLSDVKESNILPKGTIIFPKRGGAIATNKKRITTLPICVDLNTMGAIPSDKLIPEYLHFYFMSFSLMDISNGTTIPQINNYSFEPLKISIPRDRLIQQRIIENLSILRKNIDDLIGVYSNKLVSLQELKKSILQKAFSGELTSKKMDVA